MKRIHRTKEDHSAMMRKGISLMDKAEANFWEASMDLMRLNKWLDDSGLTMFDLADEMESRDKAVKLMFYVTKNGEFYKELVEVRNLIVNLSFGLEQKY